MIFKPAQLGMAKLDPQELEADKKACRKIGPCGVGKKALYLNSFYIDRRYYLPYGSITRVFKRGAMSSGGFFGKGFLQGTQTKFNFVPEQSTDFIFCTVGEEWGFLGSSVVILLLMAFILRMIKLAERQRSAFSRVYGYGVASILFFHVAVNIGMTIGLVPVIGIPLPFFSYGGSSLWAFTILIFIFLRLDANRLQVFR